MLQQQSAQPSATLTTQLAAKQGILSVSSGGAGSPTIDLGSNTIRKLSVTGNSLTLTTVNAGNGLQIAADAYTTSEVNTHLAGKQDTVSNFSGSGFELFASGKLKRLDVPLSLSLGVPLQMAENTAGTLTLTSNSYSSSMVDTAQC